MVKKVSEGINMCPKCNIGRLVIFNSIDIRTDEKITLAVCNECKEIYEQRTKK